MVQAAPDAGPSRQLIPDSNRESPREVLVGIAKARLGFTTSRKVDINNRARTLPE